MKNKRKVIFILIGIYLLSGVVFYKVINLNYYHMPNITTFGVQISQAGFIGYEMTKIEDSEYLEFHNLKIRNDFSEFYTFKKQPDDNYLIYTLYNEDDTPKATFSIKYTNQQLDLFIESNEYQTEQLKDLNKEYFIKNNITNDIELIKYLRKNKNVKNNIFTSVKKMKNNYYIKYLYSTIFGTNVDNITILNGKHTGYTFKDSNNNTEFNILINNKRYSLQFMSNEYFTDEYINELIDTMVIE